VGKRNFVYNLYPYFVKIIRLESTMVLFTNNVYISPPRFHHQ